MKAFLVAVCLLFSATCFANPPPSTQPPPFVPVSAPDPAQAAPGPDDLLRALLGVGEQEEKPGPTIECTSRPCVPAYRFSDHIDEDTVKTFGKFIAAATAAKPDLIMVELNTPGGSMDDGHEMSRMIEHTPVPVVCIVDGTSASMGMYILASCDIRVMTKRSQLMIHQVHLMVPQGHIISDVSNENAASIIQVATRAYIEWVSHRFKNTPVASILQRISFGREWWMNWEEAIRIGAIDKAVDVSPDHYLSQLKKTGKP
jgi:ATP-dependent protease ClpP protease subunit